MTHRQASSHARVRRSLIPLAAAASLALFGALGSGCTAGETSEPDDDDDIGAFFAAVPEVDCANLKEWALNTVYPAGTRVTDTGNAFQARSSHTALAPNWNPKNAGSLWLVVGHCKGAGGGQPPQQPPPPPPGGGQPPPPPPGQCNPNGRPGPIFDPAGPKNVGNGRGQQFIGGQCLDAADCASGCCANPCGICSGPGAQFQNGKQGCGFDG